ncbi:olfactory receptor 5P66-like [Rhinophrynus dorsalis]
MSVLNQTFMEFHLVGFQNLHSFKIIFFCTFLMLYVVTLTGNLTIIMLVTTNDSLKSAMYFFLCNLSLCDIILTTNISPNMLHSILINKDTISITGCLTQFYFFALSGTAECHLLTAMSYDRYLAICKPLRYHSIMTFKLCLHLIIFSWLVSVMLSLNITLLFMQLDFCRSDVIDHFFCDFLPLIELSCSDTSIVVIEDLVLNVPITLFPFVFIVVTYAYIIHTIMKIPSTSGRQKTFSTCSSHLTVVFMFYGTVIIIYLVPSKGYLKHISKLLSLLYTVFTPMLNPIIYSLRNQEIQKSLRNIINPNLKHSTI